MELPIWPRSSRVDQFADVLDGTCQQLDRSVQPFAVTGSVRPAVWSRYEPPGLGSLQRWARVVRGDARRAVHSVAPQDRNVLAIFGV